MIDTLFPNSNPHAVGFSARRLRLPFAGRLVAFLLTLAIGLGYARIVCADAATDFDVAYKHYKAMRYDLSADSFTDFIRKNPGHSNRPLADLYLGQSLMHLNRFADARTVFSQFLKANPTHADHALAMYRDAECSFFLSDPKSASVGFDAFLKKYPDNDLVEYAAHYLGESQLQLNQPEAAVPPLKLSLEKFPMGRLATQSRFSLAKAYVQLKQPELASAMYREVAADEKNPRAAEALFAMGSQAFDGKNFAVAAEAFSTLRAKFPDYKQVAAADLNAGYAYFNLGQFNSAVEAFDRAAQSPKDKFDARFWAGQARRKEGRYEDAVAINRQAYEEFKDEPKAAKFLYYQAECEFQQKHYDQSIALFTQFVDRYPQNDFTDDSLHFAVDASLRAGNLAQAEQLHQRFVKEYPANRSGLAKLENLLYGRVLLAKADAANPNGPLSEASRGDVKAAADLFEDVARTSMIERTADWARLLLARAKAKLGDPAGVIAATTPINERIDQIKDPEEFAESLYLTGRAAVDLQNWDLADQAFERYVRLSKNPGNVTAALTQLALARVGAGKAELLDSVWKRFSDAGVPAADIGTAVQASAELAHSQQRFADSAKLFEKLESFEGLPEYQAIARSGLGHARYNLREYAAAADAFGRLAANPPANQPALVADAAFMKGFSLEKNNQPQEAAAAYEAGAMLIAGRDGKIGPPPADEKAAWNAYQCLKLAAAQYESLKEIGKADAAFAEAWQYLKQLPADRRVELDKLLYNWATANYNAKRYAEADALYKRLLDDHPQSSYADQAAFYLAESLHNSGKTDEAVASLKKIIESPQTDDALRPEVLFMLVELSAGKEDWEGTRNFASQLIERYPASPKKANAEYRLAEAAVNAKDSVRALLILGPLRKSIAADEAKFPPEVQEGVWILSAEAELMASPTNYEAVDRLIEEFHKKFPESKVGFQMDYIAGRSFIKRAPPDFAKGREFLQKVVDSPEAAKTVVAANADFRIADSYLISKTTDDLELARRRFYDVGERYTNSPEIQAAAYYKAGECEETRGKPGEAIQAYRSILARFGESEFAGLAKTRLKALNAETPPP